MLLINPQAGSKEPAKEAGEDQHKLKTANQASTAKRRAELGGVDTRPRAERF